MEGRGAGWRAQEAWGDQEAWWRDEEAWYQIGVRRWAGRIKRRGCGIKRREARWRAVRRGAEIGKIMEAGWRGLQAFQNNWDHWQ